MQSLNLRLTRDNLSRPWGFRLQGGYDTGYPLSVQRVFSGSPAEGVLQRGDVIKFLDTSEAESLNGKEIQDIIRTSGRQFNFIVERDSNKENFHDLLNDNEPKVSVKAARKKFISTENKAPKPFGEFGTHYDKKDNSEPTGLRIEKDQEYHFDQNRHYHNQNEEEDEKVDYSFMTLPVNERKKLFATPNDSNTSKTMPRQRSYSFRPAPKSYEVTTRIAQCQPHSKAPQYGWGPSHEKLINARTVSASHSSATLRPKSEISSFNRKVIPQSDKYATIAFPHSVEENRRYSSSAHINQNRPTWGNNTLDSGKRITTHIYRCGTNQEKIMIEPMRASVPRIHDTKPLFVKTYPVQSMTTSESPRMFRPAYPAFSTDQNQGDNWSTISMRSEPYSRFHERNLAVDKSGVYRLNQEPVVIHRNMNKTMNQTMNTLQIGEPRTRVIASPASPSFHLNKSFWNSDSAPRTTYEQPTHHYYVKTNPMNTLNSPSIRREITVPKSHSNIHLNHIRQTNEDVYSQVSWLKQHRGSLEGASDF